MIENERDKYRLVFMSNPIAIEVLGDILSDLHFGCTLKNEVEMLEYNLGVVLLAKCGVFGNKTLGKVVNALSSVIPDPEKKIE